jgi:hypothetical protein
MLSVEQMQRLKRSNVSVDADKTMERFKEDFGASSAGQKRVMEEVSGQAINSYYRIGQTGAISVRLALAMANEFNVTPFYYSGETDEKDPCSDIAVKRFLEANGYDDIAAELEAPKKKRPYNRKLKVDAPPETAPAITPTTVETDVECKCEADADKCADADCDAKEVKISLTEDEAIILLRALYIRAKAGGDAASNLNCLIKCLLS